MKELLCSNSYFLFHPPKCDAGGFLCSCTVSQSSLQFRYELRWHFAKEGADVTGPFDFAQGDNGTLYFEKYKPSVRITSSAHSDLSGHYHTSPQQQRPYLSP